MSDACCYCAERNQRRLAELRTLLAGIPGDSLTEQVRGLLQDRERIDRLEARVHVERYPSGAEVRTIHVGSDGPCRTLRESIDAYSEPSLATLAVNGVPFRCPCGANVFVNEGSGVYRCNACDAEYEGTAIDAAMSSAEPATPEMEQDSA